MIVARPRKDSIAMQCLSAGGRRLKGPIGLAKGQDRDAGRERYLQASALCTAMAGSCQKVTMPTVIMATKLTHKANITVVVRSWPTGSILPPLCISIEMQRKATWFPLVSRRSRSCARPNAGRGSATVSRRQARGFGVSRGLRVAFSESSFLDRSPNLLHRWPSPSARAATSKAPNERKA